MKAFAPNSTAWSVTAATFSVLLAGPAVLGQYAPPPPPAPFAGFINEALREKDPANKAWDIGGSARARFEIKDGAGIAGVPGSLDFRENNADNHNAYFLERIRLRAGYRADWWGVLVEGRSSLAQGDERFAFAGNPSHKGHGPESDSIDLHQAHLTVGNPAEFPLSLKVGRQELSYGEERFVGSFGWNNIGRVFDAAKIRYENECYGIDLFTSRPVIPEDELFNVSNDYESFTGLHAAFAKVPKHLLDAFVFSRNASTQAATAEPRPQFPQPTARDIVSLGVRLKSKPGEFGPWDYGIEAVGQFGNYKDVRAGAPVSRLDHTAFAAIAQGGYTFKDCPATPRLGLEYSFASGDSDPTDGDHGTFDNLYPTNHKFYGYADFVSLQNLHDVRAILQLKPLKSLSVALEGHAFWLADTHDNFYAVSGAPRGGTGPTPGTGYGVNPAYDSFVGTELDLVAGYALTRYAQVEAGYAHFFVGDYIDASLADPRFGARDADFFYLQVNANF